MNNFLDIPRASTGAIGVGGGQIGAGGVAGDFLRTGGAAAAQLPANIRRNPITDRPASGNGGIGSGAVGNRGQNLVNNRPDRVENRQQVQGNRQQRRDEVRNQVAHNYPRLNFWSQYPHWAAWRITRPYRWATWAAIGAWVGYGSIQPSYYSYGDNIYYSGNQVYYGDQPVATAEQYADQAAALVASAPANIPPNSDWLPLGVFAVTQDGQASGSDPNLFVQLAISKDGIITGTFQNMATNEVQGLEGMIDKQSQRAAWGIVGKQWPIVETGISNLTQDTAPVLVHFADGQTQQWLLVRLEEPAQQ